MEKFFRIKGKNGFEYLTRLYCYNNSCPDWFLDVVLVALAIAVIVGVLARFN